MLSAIGYAIGPIIVARKLTGIRPIGVVAASLVVATLIYLPALPFHWPSSLPIAAIGSIATLAILCTAVAFMLLFALIAESAPLQSVVRFGRAPQGAARPRASSSHVLKTLTLMPRSIVHERASVRGMASCAGATATTAISAIPASRQRVMNKTANPRARQVCRAPRRRAPKLSRPKQLSELGRRHAHATGVRGREMAMGEPYRPGYITDNEAPVVQ